MLGMPNRKGRRTARKQVSKKVIIISAILVSVLILVIFISFIVTKNKKNKEDILANANVEVTEVEEPEPVENAVEEEEIVDISDLPDSMGGYKVIGELVIDKIDLKKSILEKTDDASLALSITKFYGPDVNAFGNFCLTGHNYNNLFKRLKELEVNDNFYMVNKETKEKVEYQIYNIYSCNPNQVECLDQPKEEVREVTLITCNPGGLTRLILKAKEI